MECYTATGTKRLDDDGDKEDISLQRTLFGLKGVHLLKV